MRIELCTRNGVNLINRIYSAVENEIVKTWEIRRDRDGNRYLTHTPDQWKDEAIFYFL